jgi:hypothetical protein
MDWYPILQRQAAKARQAVESVPRILDHPRVSQDQCSRLLAGITATRAKLETIQAHLTIEGDATPLAATAGQLSDIWGELFKVTARRMERFGEQEAV